MSGVSERVLSERTHVRKGGMRTDYSVGKWKRHKENGKLLPVTYLSVLFPHLQYVGLRSIKRSRTCSLPVFFFTFSGSYDGVRTLGS